MLQSLADRVFQYVVNLMLRCVTWEAELKKGNLTLSTLRFQLSETSDIVRVMLEVVSAARDAQMPGKLVDSIGKIEAKYAHMTEAGNVCRGLREAAFEPVASFMLKMIFRGDLSHDIFSEMFVKRSESGELKLIEDEDSIPSVFQDSIHGLLECATCASILRDHDVSLSPYMTPIMVEAEDNPLKLMDKNFVNVVTKETLHVVNQLLLSTVNKDNQLLTRIIAIKKYLLISESDWFTQFLEQTLHELEKPVKSINRIKINEALRAVATNISLHAVFDCYPIDEFNLPEHERVEDKNMLGIRALTLDVTCEYPMSLVLTNSIMEKFKVIFRHLAFCKYVETQLSAVWSEFQLLRSVDIGGSMLSCNLLLQKMLHFIKNYLFFLFVDVIESKLITTTTSSSVAAIRDNLDHILAEIITELNMTNFIYKSINKVISTCGLFSAHMSRFIRLHIENLTDAEDKADVLHAITSQEKYSAMITKFEDAFQGQTNSLMVQLKSAHRINRSAANLIARLDFNEFFSDKLGV